MDMTALPGLGATPCVLEDETGAREVMQVDA